MLSPLLLEHYDPTKKLVVAADACQTGIGGVLIQRDLNGYEHAVYHISQSLTEAQKNYSQIEKEALALVTAVERFHKFYTVTVVRPEIRIVEDALSRDARVLKSSPY